MSALIKREFLEHKGAYLYAPTVITVVLFGSMLLVRLTRHHHFPDSNVLIDIGDRVYTIGATATFGLWTAYLMVALFFYFADSFSADRRNNALLFWKSMPQSDFTILGSKALAAVTLFPTLILGFAFISAVLLYFALLGFSIANPMILPPNPVPGIISLVQALIAGAVYMVLSVLWFAPFLAWVAGLSTLFQRWSIPLALLVPALISFIEFMATGASRYASHPIADYLGWRFDTFVHDETLFKSFVLGHLSPLELIPEFLRMMDWSQLGIGVLFSLIVIYLASEYRRRHIEA